MPRTRGTPRRLRRSRSTLGQRPRQPPERSEKRIVRTPGISGIRMSPPQHRPSERSHASATCNRSAFAGKGLRESDTMSILSDLEKSHDGPGRSLEVIQIDGYRQCERENCAVRGRSRTNLRLSGQDPTICAGARKSALLRHGCRYRRLRAATPRGPQSGEVTARSGILGRSSVLLSECYGRWGMLHSLPVMFLRVGERGTRRSPDHSSLLRVPRVTRTNGLVRLASNVLAPL